MSHDLDHDDDLDLTLDTDVRPVVRHRVRFTRQVFDPGNPVLREVMSKGEDGDESKALVVIDNGLLEAQDHLPSAVTAYFQTYRRVMPELRGLHVVPGGEAAKNDPGEVDRLLAQIHRGEIDRRSYVVAVGGGAVLDAAGFAAATAHRGVRLLRLPSTTLAQGDSGVGVKHGVNRFGQKNFLGGFAVPWAVVNDATLLGTLSDRDWRCGLAEAAKVALLKDAAFFAYLEGHTDALANRDAAVGDAVWRRSAELHLRHIAASAEEGGGGDPFELDAARPLDLGHWSAHKLEALSGFTLRHGEAVAIGLAIDTDYAARVGLTEPATAARVIALLQRLGFDLRHPLRSDPRLLDGVEEFRAHLGGRLTLTLPGGVAESVVVHAVDLDAMRAAAAGGG
ncbi:MAG: 3-dehydroquinate synthase [Planctomycetota bacterium]